ncbi:CDGSH iron-sulfur domain-containing protein [Marinobacterium mangrovicola]|uniref:Iron-binding CDGSH zinc finger protein n=1 Tax=Marinobacterium mangrovicola TaxID=1476959 RepID=A0A4R1GPX0_9GAMM|nr:CDGSH iron-sulfur domain-containing protein [Marinobacterium mangrovicola]TCK09403.1 iron-binding CDGSH zinc finger protein [Marinobacterium mangrovicola]
MSHSPVHRAGSTPVTVKLKQGEVYAWCACGRSANQPFCDGSHVGTGLDPLVFEAEKDDEVQLCTCKFTATPPICDGSHCNESHCNDSHCDDEQGG